MKTNELRELSIDELLQKRDDLNQAFFNLKIQHATGQLENTASLKFAKRDIARVKTIIRQNEMSK